MNETDMSMDYHVWAAMMEADENSKLEECFVYDMK